MSPKWKSSETQVLFLWYNEGDPMRVDASGGWEGCSLLQHSSAWMELIKTKPLKILWKKEYVPNRQAPNRAAEGHQWEFMPGRVCNTQRMGAHVVELEWPPSFIFYFWWVTYRRYGGVSRGRSNRDRETSFQRRTTEAPGLCTTLMISFSTPQKNPIYKVVARVGIGTTSIPSVQNLTKSSLYSFIFIDFFFLKKKILLGLGQGYGHC